jgi:hypothetical protein
MAWLFNPWTGSRRLPEDVGSDTFGYLILASHTLCDENVQLDAKPDQAGRIRGINE